MINLLTGRPGGGKSYEAVVYHIIPAIKEGRKVVTNIPVNKDKLINIFGIEVDNLLIVIDGQLTDFGNASRPFANVADYQDDWRDDNGRAPLYVVDECHMVLPNRGCNVEILEWYSTHRHFGADILLITQNARKIHRDIKDMVEVHYYCVKNTTMGSSKTYTRKVRNGAGGEILNQSVREYKKDYFQFYKSHTASNKSVEEATAKDVKPIWKHWTFAVALICLVSGPAWLISNGGFFSGMADDAPPQETPMIEETNESQLTETTQTNQPQKSRRNTKTVDPLSNFKLYVSGESNHIRFDSNKQLVRDSTFKRIYIDVFEGDYKMFTFTNHDLTKLGYTFSVVADCVYMATFEDVSRLIICGDYQAQRESQNMFAKTVL
ncbi:zonular occludens toxin domain-containing protein [Vibrio astriarenae]